MMILKEVYAKHKANHPLTDDELEFLIEELGKIESSLECLGVEYRITTNAIRYDLIALKSYLFHRKFR